MNPAPHLFHGVMLSSTFTDLQQHRAALIKAVRGQDLTDVVMENDSAKANVDVIDSSLQMVRDGSAYIGVTSRKYGQTPGCSKRNPEKLLSLCKLSGVDICTLFGVLFEDGPTGGAYGRGQETRF